MDRFEALLREKLSIIEDMRVQATLSQGLSFEEYQYNLGFLEALRRVYAACEEIQSDTRKE